MGLVGKKNEHDVSLNHDKRRLSGVALVEITAGPQRNALALNRGHDREVRSSGPIAGAMVLAGDEKLDHCR